MKKIKVIYIILIISILSIGGVYALIRWDSIKEINKTEMNTNAFINIVDNVSDNRVQVNWKYVAAIIGVIEKNDFEQVRGSRINEIAKMFINDNDELKSLETVLNELDFSEREKERTLKYIDDLKYYGLTPNRTQKDTKQMQFIESIKEPAIENYKKYKVLPSITIAQAILESNWGESKLASEFNNLFGVKADTSWEGEHVTLETTEFDGMIIDDKFRKYEDKDQSIYDHGKFLFENKRYRNNGVFDSNTYRYQANALQNAGYSTLTNEKGEMLYANKLIQLIKQYNLHLIDSEIQDKIEI